MDIPCDTVHLQSNFYSPPVFRRFEVSLSDCGGEFPEKKPPIKYSRSLSSATSESSTITEMDIVAAKVLLELSTKNRINYIQCCRLVDVQSSCESVKDRNSMCSDANSVNLFSGDHEEEELLGGNRRGKRRRLKGREDNVDELDRRRKPRFRFISEILLSSSM